MLRVFQTEQKVYYESSQDLFAQLFMITEQPTVRDQVNGAADSDPSYHELLLQLAQHEPRKTPL